MYEYCGLFFCGTHMQWPFLFFLDIFTLKNVLLHAVYVAFHLSGILKLLHYGLLEIHIYDSQIVHQTSQGFKSFYPVYFVNDC